MPEAEFNLRPIGWVRSPVSSPRDHDWGSVESDIVLDSEYAGGLEGIGDFSHVLVLTLLHGARYEAERHLRRRPQGRDDMPRVGIFSQRAKDRPNPIGVTCVPLLAVASDSIRVRGLDAIDGTPVLDIKPHFPQYDSPKDVMVPEWVDRLMRDYF